MSRRLSSAMERALVLVDQGYTRYAAAKREGLSLSAVYKAVIRRNRLAPPAGGQNPEPAPDEPERGEILKTWGTYK